MSNSSDSASSRDSNLNPSLVHLSDRILQYSIYLLNLATIAEAVRIQQLEPQQSQNEPSTRSKFEELVLETEASPNDSAGSARLNTIANCLIYNVCDLL